MSLMFPENLSRGGKKPRKPNHDLPPELGMGPTPPEPSSGLPPRTDKPLNPDPFTERDEYGAELGKEARVWKIYVKETDRADAELVDGWNKSLDVILVFAALFSAISTAFLIESSQKLQEDPADVTAQTLLAISRTLSILANSSQPTASEPSSGANSTPFSPPRTVVAVNTLWYLSLSLSVATSLLAMLAKDWCHSFMANRTGHPYTQSLRRQQKWMMIEKWKMQELIVVLPSLIHLSLLLFAIGLCIYVWEMNSNVGIPVVCVTGAALCFYIWSSITASVVEYFPYTTVISRFLQSDWTKTLTKWTIMLLVSPKTTLSPFFTEFSEKFELKRITVARETSRLLSKTYYNNVFGWFGSLDRRLYDLSRALSNWANITEGALPAHLRVPQLDDNFSFITPALHWLIKCCEVPSAVDSALQAIAGANPQTYRKPLEECDAALEISKRLVSGNIYDRDDMHVVSLYVRSLSFLGSKNPAASNARSNTINTGGLQVTIWNLQAQYDNQVAQLVADGNFIPSDHNVAALRVGSSIASYMMRALNGLKQADDSPFETALQLLQGDSSGTRRLHPAALRSLFNTFELLSTTFQMLANTLELLSLSTISSGMIFQLICWLAISSFDEDRPTSSATSMLRCAYALALILERPGIDSEAHRALSLQIVVDQGAQLDTESRTLGIGEIVHQTLSRLLQVRDSPDQYSIGSSFNSLHVMIYNMEGTNHQTPRISDPDTHLLDRPFYYAIPRYFSVLHLEYGDSENPVPNPSARVYLFTVQVILSTQSYKLWSNCRTFLSRSPFPGLSLELVETLEKHNIIPLLEQTSTSTTQESQMWAICILWVLCALEVYASPGADAIRDRLSTQLRGSTAWGGSAEMKRALGCRVFDIWKDYDWQKWDVSTDRFITRTFECVVEAGDHAAPRTEASVEEFDNGLREQINPWARRRAIESSLRGLAAFTAYPEHNQPTSERESPQPEPHRIIEVTDVNAPEDWPGADNICQCALRVFSYR